MRTGTIKRITEKSGDQGTFSRVSVMAAGSIDVVALQIVFGELPWRDDKADVSCLPPAPGGTPITWLLKYQWSQEHKKNNYRVQGIVNLEDGSVSPVPDGRTCSEIHSMNLMGDIFKGYAAQALGCMGPGTDFSIFPVGSSFYSFTARSPMTLVPVKLTQPQLGVESSGAALAAFEKELNGEDLSLTSSWV